MSQPKYVSPQDYAADIYTPMSERAAKREKPVVKYLAVSYGQGKPEVGFRHWIIPLDHPAEYLNNLPANTSSIVSAEDNGNFETLNTKYVLVTN